jgi:colanic acid/amylovoran biosynthesis glycosyltransferase
MLHSRSVSTSDGRTINSLSLPAKVDRMTIAYLVSQYPAASHTFIRREVKALRLRGFDVQTFSIRRPMADELSSPDDQAEFAATYYLLPAKVKHQVEAHLFAMFTRPSAYLRVLLLALKHRVPGIRAFLWALFHFAEAIQLARELQRRQIQRVHNHFANSGATVGLLASSFLQLPWSLTLHGISETDYPAGLLLSDKIQAASFVACVSEYGRAQAMRISPPDHWSKLVTVPCAIDVQALPEKSARDRTEGTRLICVGRLSPEKGHLGLLEAFAKVLARAPSAELTLVGDGPERQKIEDAVDRWGLHHHVRLTGTLSERATLQEIANSDVFVLASFMEGLPVVLMEAMALGLPVVASRVAGIPELVFDRENGLLFSPSNWEQLADKLSALITDSALRRRLGDAGRTTVLNSHDTRNAFGPLILHFRQPHDHERTIR